MVIPLIISTAVAIIVAAVAALLGVGFAVVFSGLLLPRHSDLSCDRIVSIFYIEFAYLLSLSFLSADQDAVEVGNFPKAFVHHFSLREDQLELLKEVFVFFTIFLVVVQEIHCFLDLHTEFR